MEYVITTPDNLCDVDDPMTALSNLADDLAPILKVLGQLQVLANASAQMNYLSQEVADALGRTPGALWRQPLGAHDIYGLGASVTWKGHLWTSLRAVNNWEPGTPDSGWRDEGPTEVEPPPPAPADPWAAGVSYTVDPLSRVSFGGKVYVCRQPHVSQAGWTPAAVPALWTEVG